MTDVAGLGHQTQSTYRAALRHRSFAVMLVCHGLGTVAQLMLTMAVGIAVLERTGSGVLTSFVVALGFLPYVAFSGLAGVVADRYSRTTVMRTSLAARACLGVLLALGILLPVPAWSVLLVLAVTAVIATPSYPALAAATPQVVDDRELPPANALVTAVENACWVAGPGAAGLVLLLGGPIWVMPVVATVLFVVATLAMAGVHVPLPRSTGESDGTWGELITGLQVVVTELRVRSAMAYAVVDNFLYGYLVVVILLVATEGLGAGETGIGWLNVSLTVGAFAAIAVANRLAAARRVRGVLIAQMVVLAGGTALMGMAPDLTSAVVVLFFASGACLIAEVVAVTVLQRSAPQEVCARVFGVYDQLNVGAIAVGSALAGPLAEAMGLEASILLVTLGAGVLGVAAAVRVGHHLQEAERHVLQTV